jgi:hypothetical protein
LGFLAWLGTGSTKSLARRASMANGLLSSDMPKCLCRSALVVTRWLVGE